MPPNHSRRTWRSRAVVIICAAIVAATGALVITGCASQQPATPRAVSCGSAWTHFVNGDTQLLGADRGALTCFSTAARECRPASLHLTEMGVDTGTEYVFTVATGGTSCQVTEQSQYYSANGGGSHGPVSTTACLRTSVTSKGVTLTCGGQSVLIPAKVSSL